MLICEIAHSSVNFTRFVLFSHQRFDDKPLFKPGAPIFDLLPFWIASKQIFLWDWNDFCYKPIANNAEFIFMEKNSEKKKVFCVLKKYCLFIQSTLYIGMAHARVSMYVHDCSWVRNI